MKRIAEDKMGRIKKIITNSNFRIKMKRMISFILFVALASGMLISVTYLFRNDDYDRMHIIGIKEEKKNSLDMVYIGGSAAFVFWQPLKAWNDCGFTSYLYATNSIQAENIKYYVKEVLKTQKPKVFVIGLRAFQYWDTYLTEAGVRRGTDSMDISLDRFKMVYYCLSNKILTEEQEKDKLSYYLDIVKYHTNYDVLKNPANWGMIFNTWSIPEKGFEWIPAHKTLEQPTCNKITEKGKLEDGAQKTFIDLLDFCKKENLKVLFTVCPYAIKEEDQMKYNTMKDIIKSYGFDYINTNENYEEMDIDFSRDFYNEAHVNCFGAEKYTAFLEDYLEEHYDLPDKRGDKLYSSWDINYTAFKEQETYSKHIIETSIQNEKNTENISKVLLTTDDIYQYISLVKDSGLTLLLASQGELSKDLSTEQISILSGLGIDTSAIQKNNADYIGVESGNSIIYKNIAAVGQQNTGTVGVNEYSISSDETEKCSIKIAKVEYALQKNGLNIVVYNNYKDKVVDSVAIDFSNEENTLMRHKN